jgi:ubiquinone/menaquinone biosynthesis C-methylase UbiE
MSQASDDFFEILGERIKGELQCPACHSGGFTISDINLTCKKCGVQYGIDAASRVCSFSPALTMNKTKNEIMDWWGDLYSQCYAAADSVLTEESLKKDLTDLEDMFKIREHLAYVEMLPELKAKGLCVLEIGPGAGGHAALFAHHGAHVTTLDITPSRAVSTAMKLALVGDKKGLSCQGDSEALPFADNTFDIVYSNGVLHHTISTVKAVEEAHRVLKPGGKAVMMLYSRHSAEYWVDIVPRAIVNGGIFHLPEANWVGRVTEGTPKFGKVKNPITRVYSASQIRKLFSGFEMVSLRKSSFQFNNFMFPGLNKIRNYILTKLGYTRHPGCTIVYGEPRFIDTKTELKLGKYIGWAWNIVARKSLNSENSA